MADPFAGASQRVDAALANMQPLRDLARNWDIDISSFLEDYLQEIVGHLANEERGGLDENQEGPPNFAQAALLLQNSSTVYSRKVEYLYSLVYAALDELVASTSGVAKHHRKTADAAIDDFNAFDPEMQFLLLDDVLPMDETDAGRAKINLEENDGDEFNGDRTGVSMLTYPTPRLSLGGMSTTGLDRSVVAPASEARSLMGSLFEKGGNLRLTNGHCDVGQNGALLMPGTAFPGSESGNNMMENDESMPVDDDGGIMYNDDDHNDGVGFDLADNHNEATSFGEGHQIQPAFQQQARAKVDSKKSDPWALLDPHDQGTTKPRPLRIGVTYRLPEGLDQPPSKSVTGASTRQRTIVARKTVDRAAPSVVSIATETFKATVAHRRHQLTMASLEEKDSIDHDTMNESSILHDIAPRPTLPLKGLAYGDEFAYIAKASAKRKAAERRERRKLLAQNLEPLEEETDNLFGFNDDDDDDSIGGNYDDEHVGNTGIASLDDAFGTPDARDTSNVGALEFEALCRAHIKAFAKGAEKYASETNLTQRVSEWQSKLAPILEEEEQRPEFNIHQYGDRVIDVMTKEIEKKNKGEPKKKDNVVDFQQVTGNCEHYEVCRLFLASLNLSSAGNVALVPGPGSLHVKLLNAQVDHPMENYMAPSATVQ